MDFSLSDPGRRQGAPSDPADPNDTGDTTAQTTILARPLSTAPRAVRPPRLTAPMAGAVAQDHWSRDERYTPALVAAVPPLPAHPSALAAVATPPPMPALAPDAHPDAHPDAQADPYAGSNPPGRMRLPTDPPIPRPASPSIPLADLYPALGSLGEAGATSVPNLVPLQGQRADMLAARMGIAGLATHIIDLRQRAEALIAIHQHLGELQQAVERMLAWAAMGRGSMESPELARQCLQRVRADRYELAHRLDRAELTAAQDTENILVRLLASMGLYL